MSPEKEKKVAIPISTIASEKADASELIAEKQGHQVVPQSNERQSRPREKLTSSNLELASTP